jgi:hypothetical protein
VGRPVDVKRPFVALKMTGSTFEAMCLTTHVPGVVAENWFTSWLYRTATSEGLEGFTEPPRQK